MNGRGLATPAAIGIVLLVGGFAIVDSIRGCQTTTTRVAPTTATEAEKPEPTTTTTDTGPAPQEDAPDDWATGELHGVLTYVAADDCRVRTIGLSSGRPRPPSRFVTDCRGFWAPKVGSRIAFGEVLSEGFFTIADLGHPRGDSGSYPIGASTAPMWSPEGRHVAWCDSPNTGVELEMLGDGTLLPFCPLAYMPDGQLAHTDGTRVMLGSQTLYRTPGRIDSGQFAEDGSVVVVLDGVRIERYTPDGAVTPVQLPATWTGVPPIASPDGCSAAVTTREGITVLPLGCGRTDTPTFTGHAASWSPDGEWLAVAEPNRIVFHHMVGDLAAELTWPAVATQLVWRR